MGYFSNHDLRELARVECDAFRYAMVTYAAKLTGGRSEEIQAQCMVRGGSQPAARFPMIFGVLNHGCPSKVLYMP
jgi:hypothetical protein